MTRATYSSPILSLALIAATFAGAAHADTPLPAADELAGRVSRALNPPRTSTRDVEIVTNVEIGTPVAWHGRQLRKTVGGERRNLTLFAAPPSVAGFAVLISESSAKEDTSWMYVPPVRRVRQMIYTGRYEYFLGSDLSASDFGFLRFDPSMKVAGKASLDGSETFLVEEEPAPKPGGYSRIRTWVSVANDLPMRREYYDQSGQLWKVMTWKNVETIETVPTPLEMTAESVQQGSRSVMKFRNVDYDAQVEDAGFTPETLASASLSPEETKAAP